MIVKVAVVAPPATGTLASTVAAAAFVLARVTVKPPVGAAAFRWTVPVDDTPPITAVGLKVTEVTAGGLIVSGAPLVPLNVAEIFAVEVAATA